MTDDTLTARRLRTGEIAIWDAHDKSLIIVSRGSHSGGITATELKGASFHAISKMLGGVIQLI